ncbi:MAG: sulfide/dihydroorotate dehydrogenase-like FAD/NAD-binding protein [Erysipelotrichales bacterium]|nr:sulfide/dihydroorotate dehydrogenase-like FAD/NAD-binding protein [Erysipelotrichales bacterium]
MYKVVKNECIKNDIYLLEVEAPLIVKSCLPGQFVIVMASETGEKIPLTIYKCDDRTNILSMIYQVVGASTLELSRITNELYSIVGPLGNPSELIKNVDNLKYASILFVAGGIGIAPIAPQAEYLKKHDINVDIIYGAKNKDSVILEDELKSICDKLTITTDDGSYGEKGLVTDILKMQTKKYDYCVAIGPLVMMKFVSLETKNMGIKTIVSMNPIMIDGTGMCGACRLIVGDEIKFACVDGPEFDGHKVDFDLAIERLKTYKTIEGQKYLEMLEGDTHHGGCGECNHE